MLAKFPVTISCNIINFQAFVIGISIDVGLIKFLGILIWKFVNFQASFLIPETSHEEQPVETRDQCRLYNVQTIR
jgi:hypothetical protein